MKAINYVVATWAGISGSRSNDPKVEYVLDTHLTNLCNILQKKKDTDVWSLIDQVTIVCPPNDGSLKNYYQFDKWEKMFEGLVSFKKLNYVGKNKHASYDQYIQAMIAFPNFEYTVVIEDDYLINPSIVNFDQLLVDAYKNLLGYSKGYLCTWAPNYGEWLPYHAAISNGIIKTSSIIDLENPLNLYYEI